MTAQSNQTRFSFSSLQSLRCTSVRTLCPANAKSVENAFRDHGSCKGILEHIRAKNHSVASIVIVRSQIVVI